MSSTPLVTVVIPTIKNRSAALRRAVASVRSQTHQPLKIEIAIDRNREGSAVTRNRALSRVTSKWVAFLDDDDYFLPWHIQRLLDTAESAQADVVYPGCKVIGPDYEEIPRQPQWGRFGEEFNPSILMKTSYIPVTSIAYTALAKEAMFGPPSHAPDSPYDDWGFYCRMYDLDGKFHHLPEVTWVWHHHGRNTSGMADRW